VVGAHKPARALDRLVLARCWFCWWVGVGWAMHGCGARRARGWIATDDDASQRIIYAQMLFDARALESWLAYEVRTFACFVRLLA
jgi:hypothetical protein